MHLPHNAVRSKSLIIHRSMWLVDFHGIIIMISNHVAIEA